LGNKVNVSIRFYQLGDDENIVELLKKTFPRWEKFDDPLELWRWKYVNTPLRSIVTVAVTDNKIVGCNHSLIFNAKLGSEITSLSHGDDLAVDTNFRGLGLWLKMQSLKYETYPTIAKYSYSTTGNPIVLKSWVKRNRSLLPFPVTRMVKTHDIDLQLQTRPMKNRLQVKVGYIFLKNLNQIINLFRAPINRCDEFKIAEISEFDEGIDSFWEKIKDDYNFILEKKHTYLNWRFTDNDRGNHMKLQAMKGDEILGYAVIGFKEGHSEGQIEDLIALKDRLDVADALLDYACKYLDDLGLNTVFYQVVDAHPYQELSRRKGFIDSRSKATIRFDYSSYWKNKCGIQFLKQTAPSQVYFNYAETI
jgi:hypothetical protein